VPDQKQVRNHPILGFPIVFESGRPFWHAIYGETYRKSLKDLKEHFDPFWALFGPVFALSEHFLRLLKPRRNHAPIRKTGPETEKSGFLEAILPFWSLGRSVLGGQNTCFRVLGTFQRLNPITF